MESSPVGELSIWNCTNCRRRKVRCDRRHPCAPCTKNKVECIFPVSGRVPRRSRDSHLKKRTELVGRLRKLEAMVGNLSSQVELSNETDQDSAEGDNDAATGQVSDNLEGFNIAESGDIVVGNRFWTVFCKEVEDIFEAVQGSTVISFDRDKGSTTASESDNGHHTGYYNFLLRNAAAAQRDEDLYPLPPQLSYLWQVYINNIDPFIKVLHVPTMTDIIREMRGSFDNLSASVRALVLAVSLAAIMSLEDKEAQANFNTGKDQLLARYQAGVELALAQADFLNKPGLTVLQTLTIYLTVLQSTGENQPVWILNGALIRLAVSMGLHTEGPLPANITYLEVEIRRRVWWQICLTDSHSQISQDPRYKLSSRMFDTNLPTNINDLDIELNPSNPSISTPKFTNTTIFLLRCSIWKLSQSLQSLNQTKKPTSPTAIEESINLLHHTSTPIEATYRALLNPENPLHLFTLTSTTLFFAKVFLLLLLSQRPPYNPETTTSTVDERFTTSVGVITHTHTLQHFSGFAPYRWQLSNVNNLPWHALRFVLHHLLKTRSWSPICEEAWSAVRKSVEDCTDLDVGQDRQYQDILRLVGGVKKRLIADGIDQQTVSEEDEGGAMDTMNAPTTDMPVDPNEGWRGPEGGNGDLPREGMSRSSREDPTLGVDWRDWVGNGDGLGSSFNFWDLSGF